MWELDKIEAPTEVGLTHLFLCREYPPAPHPPGGIGTYVRRVAAALADAGETVHVIAQRWRGAPAARVESSDGRLIVHRVPLDGPLPGRRDDGVARRTREAWLRSTCPVLAFAWQAGLLAESLVDSDGVDVIEASDWEAPLYFLLARRAERGVAPAAPVLVVHLHSSSHQVYAANRWDRTVTDFAPLAAAEAATISGADALLSPSRYVADQVCTDYALALDRVSVVPYPLDPTPPLTRDDAAWSRGGICHIGRLEPRKGVLEWVEGWATTALDAPDLHFAGSDTPVDVTGGRAVGTLLREAVPTTLQSRLHFHGTLAPSRLEAVLVRSWAAVVPSRWDNLPYSCLEAMASGLPVIASPCGGMKELVRDGESGWIADGATAAALAATLRRAMATPPAERRRMGDAAAAAIAAACDTGRVVRTHLDLKRTWLAAPRARAGTRFSGEPLRPVEAPDRPRYSAMARAVVRDHRPLWEWWRLVPAEDRRRLVTTAIRHPLRALSAAGLAPAWARSRDPKE